MKINDVVELDGRFAVLLLRRGPSEVRDGIVLENWAAQREGGGIIGIYVSKDLLRPDLLPSDVGLPVNQHHGGKIN